MCTVGGCLCTSQWQGNESCSCCSRLCSSDAAAAPVIVVGDMNQCKLDVTMPGFKQNVKGQTRKCLKCEMFFKCG